MQSIALGVLMLFAIVAFNNYRAGTLGQWLGAKFLNTAAPKPGGDGAGSAQAEPSGLTIGATGRDALHQASGRLMHPTGGAGSITDRFGADRPGTRTHAGLDIAVPVGTPVLAAAGGRVVLAGPSSGYGFLVTIDHGGGLETRYGHLSRIDVHLAQSVLAGQRIALSGNTGVSTGPHLHFEVRQYGKAVDPEPWLSTATVSGADIGGVGVVA